MGLVRKFDLIIVGGGLAGCLALHAIKHINPKLRVLLIEKNDQLAGNHTWSFHEADLPKTSQAWLRPLITQSWPGYWVHFPEYSREFNSPYHSISSEDLNQRTQQKFGSSIMLNTEVVHTKFDPLIEQHLVEVRPSSLTTISSPLRRQDDGSAPKVGGTSNLPDEPILLQAETVLLARGWTDYSNEPVAWQKFVGLEVELEEPHGLSKVSLMDARVQQIDGYRFFYLLPWSPTRLLAQDTYYSHHSGLKSERIEQEITNFIRKQNWRIKSILRKEAGSLPLSLSLPTGTKQARNPFPSIGAESGYFHPVTGSTAPTLLKQLCAICDQSNLTSSSISRVLRKVEENSQSRLRYYRLLNRMMFKGTNAPQRYKVLAHLYRMPEPLIERFYTGQTSIWDQMRILMRKPPIDLGKAIGALKEK